MKRIEQEKQKLIADGIIKKEKPLKPITEEEKPFEIPESWEWVRLYELGICQTGTTPSKSNKEFYGNEYPFIKPDNILDNGTITKAKEYLSSKGILKGRFVENGSILMVCIGSIGKAGIVNSNCSCNQQINFITCFRQINNKYILLAMLSPYFQLETMNKSSQTTLPILNKTSWERLLIPLPPLAEQQRIVDKIEQMFSIIDSK